MGVQRRRALHFNKGSIDFSTPFYVDFSKVPSEEECIIINNIGALLKDFYLYSYNNFNWETLEKGTNIVQHRKVYIKCSGFYDSYNNAIQVYAGTPTNPANVAIGGNIRYLRDPEFTDNLIDFTFGISGNYTDASKLIIEGVLTYSGLQNAFDVDRAPFLKYFPTFEYITGIESGAHYAFAEAFKGNTFIETTPKFSKEAIMTSSNHTAFQSTFEGCTNLKRVNDIPFITQAVELNYAACNRMFKGCTSLLNVLNLGNCSIFGDNSCREMYAGCVSLKDVSMCVLGNGTATAGKSAFHLMFSNCNSLEKLPILKLKSITGSGSDTSTSWQSSFYAMFDNAQGDTELILPSNYFDFLEEFPQGCFEYMFSYNKNLHEIPSDFLNVNNRTLKKGAFSRMFYSSGITTIGSDLFKGISSGVPENCCDAMFAFCEELLELPEGLIHEDFISSVSIRACSYMFRNCYKLTSLPTLSPKVLAEGCYYGMFSDCTGLTQAPELPATTLANYCYEYMFNGCTSLTQAPELPATTLANSCYSNMFNGCTSLTQAPELPATTLANYCYEYMFNGCTSLIRPATLPARNILSGCYSYMFANCSNIKLSATRTGAYVNSYRIPSSGTGTYASTPSGMFSNTGGTFKGTPTINTTYYYA